MNPMRIERIKQLAGWGEVYPGTLNIRTDRAILRRIARRIKPLWTEMDEAIVRPASSKKRTGPRWDYCRGYIARPDLSLIVRCIVRLLHGGRPPMIEIVSNLRLRGAMGLRDGSRVLVAILNADDRIPVELPAQQRRRLKRELLALKRT